MATAARLPAIVRSPTTLQYQIPRSRPRPFYKPRFTLTKSQRAKTLDKAWLRKTDPLMPPYPYGKNQTFREANYGLYGGSTIQSGNKISKGRNKGKTVRKWYPNVRLETVKSEALNMTLTIPITARCLRTINKCGGLDQYLLGNKPARIKELGLLGWKLRWLVMNSEPMKEKYAAERARLGLPRNSTLSETFADAWNDPARRQKFVEEQTSAWEKLRAKAERFQRHVEQRWTEPGAQRQYQFGHVSTLRDHHPKALELPAIIEEVQPSTK